MANKEISAQYDQWLKNRKRAETQSQVKDSVQKQQKINAVAKSVLDNYEKKISSGSYMSPDEIDTYNFAVDMFERSGNTIRGLQKAYSNSPATDDGKTWERSIYDLRGRANQIAST